MTEENPAFLGALRRVQGTLSKLPTPWPIKAALCLQCGWVITGETEQTVMDAHHVAQLHSNGLDEGAGHGPVLLIADIWDWWPEPRVDSRLEP